MGMQEQLDDHERRLDALEGASGDDPTDLEDAYRDLTLARDEITVHVEVAKVQRLRAEAAERERDEWSTKCNDWMERCRIAISERDEAITDLEFVQRGVSKIADQRDAAEALKETPDA